MIKLLKCEYCVPNTQHKAWYVGVIQNILTAQTLTHCSQLCGRETKSLLLKNVHEWALLSSPVTWMPLSR
jgi:hypothetical protein